MRESRRPKIRSRSARPGLEGLESRALPSHLAATSAAAEMHQRFAQAPSNGSIPNNAPNQLITPTGVPTRRESRRENFQATFVGEYTIGPGRFSTEAADFYFRGVGRDTQVLNADIQLRVVRPSNPSQDSTGILSIFDRNIDSNSVLGYDVYATPTQLDALGRPTKLALYALDTNISAGLYVDGQSQGTMTIHYGKVPASSRPPHYSPPGRTLPGVLSQGTASITIHAQLYTWQSAFNLRNVSYNP